MNPASADFTARQEWRNKKTLLLTRNLSFKYLIWKEQLLIQDQQKKCTSIILSSCVVMLIILPQAGALKKKSDKHQLHYKKVFLVHD